VIPAPTAAQIEAEPASSRRQRRPRFPRLEGAPAVPVRRREAPADPQSYLRVALRLTGGPTDALATPHAVRDARYDQVPASAGRMRTTAGPVPQPDTVAAGNVRQD
jgi:hypothetical protein